MLPTEGQARAVYVFCTSWLSGDRAEKFSFQNYLNFSIACKLFDPFPQFGMDRAIIILQNDSMNVPGPESGAK